MQSVRGSQIELSHFCHVALSDRQRKRNFAGMETDERGANARTGAAAATRPQLLGPFGGGSAQRGSSPSSGRSDSDVGNRDFVGGYLSVYFHYRPVRRSAVAAVKVAAACRLRACPPSHRSRTLPRLLRGGVLALAAGVAHGGQRSAHGLAKPASSPRPARRCLAAIAIVCVPFALTGFAIRRQ